MTADGFLCPQRSAECVAVFFNAAGATLGVVVCYRDFRFYSTLLDCAVRAAGHRFPSVIDRKV